MAVTTRRIKDNPSHAELVETSTGMAALARVVGFLEKFGIKNKALSEAIGRVPAIVEQTNQLINLPDRFNDHFSARGWIAYESLNLEIMQNAVDLADDGRIDAAEEQLVAHYTADNMRFMLIRLYNIEQFQARRELTEKALDDYDSERYHAAVPVLLTIIDGFVNDIEQTGFFAACTDLTAWDSIAAHSTGLSALCDVLTTSRMKTTGEEITLPYRHGILHGRDLGYGNKLVAAKTWAALFAVADWAIAIRNGKKHPIPKEPTPGLFESLRKLADTQQRKKTIAGWLPRTVCVGDDCPVSGVPTDYDAGSPEQTAVHFLDYWKQRNYGHMAKLLKCYTNESIGKRAGKIREEFGNSNLIGFKITSIEHVAPAIAEVHIAISFEKDGTNNTDDVSIRLIHQDDDGDPRVYPGEDGG